MVWTSRETTSRRSWPTPPPRRSTPRRPATPPPRASTLRAARLRPTRSSPLNPVQPPDEPATDTGGGLVRLRLHVSYDGTALHGWARQPGQRTVQGDLEQALAMVLRIPVDL